METKCITSINRVETENMFIHKVILDIKKKCTVESKHYIIKKDNAKAHTIAADNYIVHDMQRDRIQMEVSNQPPSSPDFNVLELRFFNSIQTLKHEQLSKKLMTW